MPGDENALAVEGLKFLREPRPTRRRRPQKNWDIPDDKAAAQPIQAS